MSTTRAELPTAREAARALAFAQGAYFVGTGVWPLLHMPSFLAVTGRKTDLWLVRTVGALVAVAGGVLASAAWRDRLTPELRALAAGTAAALGTVDVVYTTRGTIPPVYLLDAVAESALVTAWASLEATRARTDGAQASTKPRFTPADLPRV
jgi:hypothetical protein